MNPYHSAVTRLVIYFSDSHELLFVLFGTKISQSHNPTYHASTSTYCINA
jgi:hypothetical protein